MKTNLGIISYIKYKARIEHKNRNLIKKRNAIFVHEFDKCVVFLKSGVKVSEGFVHEYESNTMKIYTQGQSTNSLVPQAEIYIYVYNSVKGECKYLGIVNKVSFNNIDVYDVSLVSSVQKRDNTRVNKQLKYKISACLNEKGEKRKLDRPMEITVLNISAQGMYFNCDKKFETGLRFPLIFRDTPRPISLTVEIIRREEFPRSFNYGCLFVGISEKDMDEIFRFVLREQIAQRRKNNIY